MSGEMERRVLSLEGLEVRAADGEPDRIEGYAAVYGVWSERLWGFVEQIAPGFFDGVLGDDVRALWQHDASFVLGRSTNGTLRLASDERGLRVVITPPDTSWARDALVSIRRGDVNQMSFGFDVEKDRWEQAEGEDVMRRTLVRASRLYDVSPVTFPAYPATTVEVRQRVDELRARLGEPGPDVSAEELRARLAMLRRELELVEL